MVREVKETELNALFQLYTELHDNPVPSVTAQIKGLWDQIMADRNHHIIIAEENGMIVSSCVCIIIPNLTHGQRPYAVIENVVTSRQYRRKGYAAACLDYARQIAIDNQCYKLMLLTGSKDESVLSFYEKAGYNRHDKTGFIQWI